MFQLDTVIIHTWSWTISHSPVLQLLHLLQYYLFPLYVKLESSKRKAQTYLIETTCHMTSKRTNTPTNDISTHAVYAHWNSMMCPKRRQGFGSAESPPLTNCGTLGKSLSWPCFLASKIENMNITTFYMKLLI